jgi:predicted AAA+ superfamily ATPase
MMILATRTGHLLNYTELSKEIGVSGNTIKTWVNSLEASGLIILLPPYYNNLGKRMIKSPKLYFCDNGLLSALLNIHSFSSLEKSPLLGNIWENFVFSELLKDGFNPGKNLFFYRDQNGVEIDFILEKEGKVITIEAKYSEHPRAENFSFKKRFSQIFADLPQSFADFSFKKNLRDSAYLSARICVKFFLFLANLREKKGSRRVSRISRRVSQIFSFKKRFTQIFADLTAESRRF